MEALKRIHLFFTLSDAEFNALAGNMVINEFTAGHRILEEGRVAVGIAVILSGRVAVTKRRADGHDDELTELGPGEIVGEIETIDGAKCSASVVCKEAVRAALVSKIDFNTYLDNHPAAAAKVLRQLVIILAARMRLSNLNYTSLMEIAESI